MKSNHRWLSSIAYTDTICNGLWVLPRQPPEGCFTRVVGTPGKLQEDALRMEGKLSVRAWKERRGRLHGDKGNEVAWVDSGTQ